MKFSLIQRVSWSPPLFPSVGVTSVAGLIFLCPQTVFAAPCSEEVTGATIYGAGGSAVTPTLANVATAVQTLPEDERLTILFNDEGGACGGYAYFRTPDPLLEVNFRYWDAQGNESICQAPQSVVEFAHMGNTPALCPGNVPLPSGAAKFVAPVQTTNVITHFDSTEKTISAEALYHIFGFGPGVTGREVFPWTNPNSVFVRRASSFVHQMVAVSIEVPASNFKLPAANFLQTNQQIVDAVDAWGDAGATQAEESLGYVSGSNAAKGYDDGQVRTLAYQHFDQTCAYLPDTSETKRDKANVRSGQYWLWTPAWFYSRVGSNGKPVNDHVANLISWFQGESSPGEIDVQSIVVDSGDVPLCAMRAMRSEGDLSAIQSYAPPDPCNGWFEYTATGSTNYQACDESDECDGAGEECRYGFCEAY